MATSGPERRTSARRLAAAAALVATRLAVALVAPVTVAAAGGPQLRPDQPITLDARSSDFDYRAGVLVFDRVRIAQGPLAIEADAATATGLDFADSRWNFRGNVRIAVEGGSLHSDSAEVVFARNELAAATIVGQPATFEQRRPDGVARGRANRIEYRIAEGTLRLADGAWLSDGVNEISSRTLVYSLRDQRIVAAAAEQGDERIRITIHPRTLPGARAPAGTQPPPRDAVPRP